MAFLTKLHKPEGFADSNKFALNPITGDLLPWKWTSLNPGDFCIDENNDLWHDCDDKKTLSRIVRNGTKANNFFQENTPPPPPSQPHQVIKVGERKKTECGVSTRGKWHSRKRKFKKQKYKNSRQRRKRNDKIFKKAAQPRAVQSRPVQCHSITPNKCKFCAVVNAGPVHGGCENMFRDPIEKYSCDCCEKCFDGPRHHGLVCEYCLRCVYKANFCEACQQNLGDWHPDWRMKLNIPQKDHPACCKCQECFQYRWLHPCQYCGMMDHTASKCPWGAGENLLLAREYLQEQIDYDDHYPYEYDVDQISEAARDDYLFGWN